MNNIKLDITMMLRAFALAEEGFQNHEVPIGCVIVKNSKVIGKGHNSTELLNDSSAHAEMIAISSAQQTLGVKYLIGSSIYVTVEPCLMCIGAILQSRIETLIYGCRNDKYGFSSYVALSKLQPKINIKQGVLETECRSLLQSFFVNKM